MELLDGVPTVFGGIGNDIRSNKLYQYNHTKDEWREHPQNLRLNQGRDAAAVFRVIIRIMGIKRIESYLMSMKFLGTQVSI